MTIKEKIKEVFKNCNEEANRKWKDHKHLVLESLNDSKEDEILLTLSIGKWDSKTFHDIKIDTTEQSWIIVQQSKYNRLLDDVMHYFVIPTIFN